MRADRSTSTPINRRQPQQKHAESFAGSDTDPFQLCVLIAWSAPLLKLLRRALDGFTNPHIGSATTKVSTHGFLNIRLSRFRCGLQQRNGTHNLSALTIAALHYIVFDPGILHHAANAILSYAFDRNDWTVANQRHRDDARACCYAGNMHRTSAAGANPATVLRAGHLQIFTQYPEKRSRGIDVHLFALTIHIELVSCHGGSPICAAIFPTGTAFRPQPNAESQRQTPNGSAAATFSWFRQAAAPDSRPKEPARLPRDALLKLVHQGLHSLSGPSQPGTRPRSRTVDHSCLAISSRTAPGASSVLRELRCCRRLSPDDNSRNSSQARLSLPDHE